MLVVTVRNEVGYLMTVLCYGDYEAIAMEGGISKYK